MDGLKVVQGRDLSHPRRQPALPVGLDAEKPRQIDEENPRRQPAPRARVLPKMMNGIIDMSQWLELFNHGCNLRRGKGEGTAKPGKTARASPDRDGFRQRKTTASLRERGKPRYGRLLENSRRTKDNVPIRRAAGYDKVPALSKSGPQTSP